MILNPNAGLRAACAYWSMAARRSGDGSVGAMFAQPVDDDRGLHLGDDATIDLLVIRRRRGDAGERAGGHEDDASPRGLHRLQLLLMGADRVVDAAGVLQRQVVGAGADEDEGLIREPRRGEQFVARLTWVDRSNWRTSTMRDPAISMASGMPISAESAKPATVAMVVGTASCISMPPSVRNALNTS